MLCDKLGKKFLFRQICHERQTHDEHDAQLAQSHLAGKQGESSELLERVEPGKGDGQRRADDKAVPDNGHEAGDDPAF